MKQNKKQILARLQKHLEFSEQYFNKEYLFKYFLNVMVFGQVDNLGKNMMLTTWDGNIWYPQFYDLDF